MQVIFNILAILLGFISAGCWFYASFVKVDHEKAMDFRRKEAERKGEKVNYASVSLDGWDMSATFKAQAKWNSFGALFAALSIGCQSVSMITQSIA
ncbi:hypothetical protein [Acinetobacter guillouiae]|uniref:hypothetical protein n=1 Tax=Acinetobacter guillouiae TaxID=106649 RepID=UPI00265234EA|nr:hypothetical protein [Acinetobacter sp.]